MQRTEIAAEKQPYTTGDRLLSFSFSILSWAWVLVILVSSWVKGIERTGYWSQPIKKEVIEDTVIPLQRKQTKQELN